MSETNNTVIVSEETEVPPITKQILKALDGRTRRWLHYQVFISERDLSLKLAGKMAWKTTELEAIEKCLDFKIDLTAK